MNAATLKKALGGRRIARRLGVTESAVGNCQETFPSRWYPVVRGLCDEAGIVCPMDAFNWATPAPEAAE